MDLLIESASCGPAFGVFRAIIGAVAPIGGVSAGGDLNRILWPLFYILAAAVVVAFAFSVVAPLRRVASRCQQKYPWIFVAAMFALYSIMLPPLLLGLLFAQSGAHLSLLIDGQWRQLFRLLFFANGHFSHFAIVLVVVWVGLQVGCAWVIWMVLPLGRNRLPLAAQRLIYKIAFRKKPR